MQDIRAAQQIAQARLVQISHESGGANIMPSLFDSGNFSDFVINCKTKTWKVHKAVLCTQSKFFESACHGSFIVCDTVSSNLEFTTHS